MMANTAEAAAPAAPPKKSKLLPVAAAALAAALAAGGGTWVYLTTNKAPEPADAAAEKAAPPSKKTTVFVPLEPFTVNLQDEDQARYLQVAVVVEAANGTVADQIKAQIPVIRNRVLLLLSSKRSEELAPVKGKEQLAEEILAQVRAPLANAGPTKGVEGVHFSSFVVQ
jgi:flagellar FliL protein